MQNEVSQVKHLIYWFKIGLVVLLIIFFINYISTL
jgi:hypothetical protein